MCLYFRTSVTSFTPARLVFEHALVAPDAGVDVGSVAPETGDDKGTVNGHDVDTQADGVKADGAVQCRKGERCLDRDTPRKPLDMAKLSPAERFDEIVRNPAYIIDALPDLPDERRERILPLAYRIAENFNFNPKPNSPRSMPLRDQPWFQQIVRDIRAELASGKLTLVGFFAGISGFENAVKRHNDDIGLGDVWSYRTCLKQIWKDMGYIRGYLNYWDRAPAPSTKLAKN